METPPRALVVQKKLVGKAIPVPRNSRRREVEGGLEFDDRAVFAGKRIFVGISGGRPGRVDPQFQTGPLSRDAHREGQLEGRFQLCLRRVDRLAALELNGSRRPDDRLEINS